MSHCVGVDVGGTTSTIAIGDPTRKVVYVSDQFATRTSDGPQETIPAIAQAIASGAKAIGIPLDQVTDIGLSTPGPATLDGVLLNTPNFDPKLWDQFPFRAELQAKIRQQSSTTSVHYIGDGQAAALGEYAIRSGLLCWDRAPQTGSGESNLSSLFMVIVGTGLGGGEVRDGRAVRGKDGYAGHAGHIFLPPYAFRYAHDQQLQVGNAKCTVESAVSLTGLAHQLEYRLTLDQWQDHPLHAAQVSARVKATRLRELAAEGDPLALELFNDQARALGIGLLSINYLGNYDLLVIGGGVCDLVPEVREQYRKSVEQAYQEFALDGFRGAGRFEFSACGDESPVMGALAHAYSQADS